MQTRKYDELVAMCAFVKLSDTKHPSSLERIAAEGFLSLKSASPQYPGACPWLSSGANPWLSFGANASFSFGAYALSSLGAFPALSLGPNVSLSPQAIYMGALFTVAVLIGKIPSQGKQWQIGNDKTLAGLRLQNATNDLIINLMKCDYNAPGLVSTLATQVNASATFNINRSPSGADKAVEQPASSSSKTSMPLQNITNIIRREFGCVVCKRYFATYNKYAQRYASQHAKHKSTHTSFS